jgi:hypothetical protein
VSSSLRCQAVKDEFWAAMMTKQQPDYLSYALHLWRPSDEEKGVWRASLQSARTRERRNFASLDDLFVFLWEQTGVYKKTGDNLSKGNEQEREP